MTDVNPQARGRHIDFQVDEEGPAHRRTRDAVAAATLMRKMMCARRFHLDDLVEGDGPYWMSLGLFIDQQNGTETSIDRLQEFADESFEATRHLVRLMIDRAYVESHIGAHGAPTYRLTRQFEHRLARYLAEQGDRIRRACSAW